MDPRAAIEAEVDGRLGDLVALSHAVHGDAELGFQEHRSSARLAEALAAGGFAVERGVAGLDTAVVATAGSGPLTIGVCAEYDALPGVGHACGHNVIAAAAVGAGLALARVADELGITVKVLGTPAEEGGGGKILMLDAGVFDGVHAAMMVHPAPYEASRMPTLAIERFHVRYRGRTAHASAYPHLGRNAADALTVAQVAIGLLRQHLTATDRVHGIVTDGGDAPNIVPDRTAGTWYVRAATLAELAELSPRVRRCFEAGALATGCEVEYETEGPPYSEFDPDVDLMRLWETEVRAIGRPFDPEVVESVPGASTDMANVSLAVPTIHPMLDIDAGGAVNHQPEFAAAAIAPGADRAVRDGAVLMARTVVGITEDPALVERLITVGRRRP